MRCLVNGIRCEGNYKSIDNPRLLITFIPKYGFLWCGDLKETGSSYTWQ